MLTSAANTNSLGFSQAQINFKNVAKEFELPVSIQLFRHNELKIGREKDLFI